MGFAMYAEMGCNTASLVHSRNGKRRSCEHKGDQRNPKNKTKTPFLVPVLGVGFSS